MRSSDQSSSRNSPSFSRNAAGKSAAEFNPVVIDHGDKKSGEDKSGTDLGGNQKNGGGEKKIPSLLDLDDIVPDDDVKAKEGAKVREMFKEYEGGKEVEEDVGYNYGRGALAGHRGRGRGFGAFGSFR